MLLLVLVLRIGANVVLLPVLVLLLALGCWQYSC